MTAARSTTQRPLRLQGPPKFLSRSEVERLLSRVHHSNTSTRRRDYALLLLMYRHGLRASEIGLLEAADVDQERSRLFVRRLKRGFSGWHRMQPDELSAVKVHLRWRRRRLPWLFVSRKGTPIARRTIDDLLKHYGADAQLPEDRRHAHALRHSIAVHLLEVGADSRFVQDWLGQVSAESMVVYTQLASPQRDAASQRAFFSLRREE